MLILLLYYKHDSNRFNKSSAAYAEEEMFVKHEYE